ncbi:MAG TPA: helix-turn-helix domain-containing protein [Micromonosporaceae bacterium]|nr:helix-turn-helix domain-containing protein [Micromonosporaceae bacterium]
MTSDHGAGSGGAVGFAELLRRHRLAAGLTQAELAARAGIGVRTIRDLERGRSVRPQRTTVELVARALSLPATLRAQFVAAARGRPTEPAPGTAASSSGAVARTLGLPAADELVGRTDEVAEIAAVVVGDPGSVTTLVGLAGVGKTALALSVAHRAAADLPGGVAGIAATAGASEADTLAAVATVFGVARTADLPARLSTAPALLMVDAVQRAPDAVAAALRRLMRIAPTLRVLVTGRQALGFAGERVWPVAPLEVPPPGADWAEVVRYPATELFLTRLRQVRRGAVGTDEVPAAGDLVRRLGGLPLAIELAAARGRILDTTEILARYGDRVLDLSESPVTPESASADLRAAVAASYELLAPPERAGLRRLAAFRNRWSLELAEAMLTDAAVGTVTDPVPLLDRLLDLGLISARGPGRLRFRLVDVVREFAAEQAAAHGELDNIRRQHAIVFVGLARRTAPQLAGPHMAAAVAALDEVTGDLWAAVAAAGDLDPQTGLTLAASLVRWWRFHGRDVLGRHWLRRLLDDPQTADAEPATRAWAQVGLAQLAQEHGAGPYELPEVLAALATFQRLGDVPGELTARTVACSLCIATGGYDEARRHSEAALALATRSGRFRDMIVAQTNLTWHEIRVGDLVAARRRLAAVERLSGQSGDERLRVLARANLAEVHRLGGRYDEAVKLGRQVLRALAGVGDPGHRRRVLGTIGLALAQAGQIDRAAEALGQLRGDRRDSEPASEDGVCASIEATIALHRGDREIAAEWFSAAAQAYAGTRDLRDVAEALVGLVASTDEPATRTAVVDWLSKVCVEGGVTLLPRERAIIELPRQREQGTPRLFDRPARAPHPRGR